MNALVKSILSQREGKGTTNEIRENWGSQGQTWLERYSLQVPSKRHPGREPFPPGRLMSVSSFLP